MYTHNALGIHTVISKYHACVHVHLCPVHQSVMASVMASQFSPAHWQAILKAAQLSAKQVESINNKQSKQENQQI